MFSKIRNRFKCTQLFHNCLTFYRTCIETNATIFNKDANFEYGVLFSNVHDRDDTKADEKKLIKFEKMLRRISGPKKNTKKNNYERMTNAELRELFNETDIIGVLKSQGHLNVRRAEDRIVIKVTIWQPQIEQDQTGRPRQ